MQRSNFSNVDRNFDERRSLDYGVLNFEELRPSSICCFTNFYVHRPSNIGTFACIDHRASEPLWASTIDNRTRQTWKLLLMKSRVISESTSKNNYLLKNSCFRLNMSFCESCFCEKVKMQESMLTLTKRCWMTNRWHLPQKKAHFVDIEVGEGKFQFCG